MHRISFNKNALCNIAIALLVTCTSSDLSAQLKTREDDSIKEVGREDISKVEGYLKLSQQLIERSEYDAARTEGDKGLTHATTVGYVRGIAAALQLQAIVFYDQRSHTRASDLLTASLDLSQKNGFYDLAAKSLSFSANLMRLTNYGRDIEFIHCEGLDSIYSIWLVSFSDHLNGMIAYTRWIYGYDYYYGWWYIPGEDDKLAVSSDGGESWSNIPKPTANVKAIHAVPDIPGAYVLADEFRVAWTRDHGDNWEQQVIPYRISEFDFSSGEVGWMAVNGTSITHPLVLKWNGDFISHVRETVNAPYPLIIYPNPVNDILHYSTVHAFDRHTLLMKDVSGKTILTGNARNGMLDIGHVPAGVYFLEMHTADSISVGKLIKTD